MLFVDKKYLSAQDCADEYGCSTSAIFTFVKQGELAWDELAFEEFGVRRVNREDFDKFLASRNAHMTESRRLNAYSGMPEGWLTTNQFSKKYQIPANMIRRWVDNGLINPKITNRGWKWLV